MAVPPVAACDSRLYLRNGEANEIDLLAVDFDQLPLTWEILSYPEHGTLEHLEDGRYIYTPEAGFADRDFVTYRVTNGTTNSLPLTVQLVVEGFTLPEPDERTIFTEDFEDMDLTGWETSADAPKFVADGSGDNITQYPKVERGTPHPRDGAASLCLNKKEWASKSIDTRGYGNLELFIRMASDWHYTSQYGVQYAVVEWFDGYSWRELVKINSSYYDHLLFKNQKVALPAGASDNPDFKIRLTQYSTSSYFHTVYFDSIRLSGDLIYADSTPPEVDAGEDQAILASGIEGGFTPDDLPVLAWYDASDVSTLQFDGSGLQTWLDKSGHGHDLIQSEAGKRPLMAAAEMNGLKRIAFDGVDDLMTTVGNPFGESIEDAFVIAVYNYEATPPSYP
ncbi:hypothetical protein BVX97_06085, partial [bacterium E08(2017)]